MKLRKYKKLLKYYHRQLSKVLVVYLLIICLSGLLLINRGHFNFIAPKLEKASTNSIALTYSQILNILQNLKEAPIKDWPETSQVRFYFQKGYILVRTHLGQQIQIDGANGKILSQGKILTPLLVQIHEGSWFAPWVKNYIFIPSTLLFFFLILSGFILLV